MGANWIEQLIV